MRRPGGRDLAFVVVLLIVAAGLGMADPHHAVGDSPQELAISPGLTPSVLWENANHNARRQSVTVVRRTYETAAAERLRRVERRSFDPKRRRARLTLFGRESETRWVVSDGFVGENVEAMRIGEAGRPDRSAIRTEGTVTISATRAGFEPGDAVARVDDPDEFRRLETTAATITIGTTGSGDYADLVGVDESDILANSSYRATIDRETGRLVRIVDRRRLRREDGDVDGYYRVTRVEKVGDTVVERPAWVPRGVVEIVADALSV